MKYKKYSYVLVFVFILMLGINNVHATADWILEQLNYEEKTCYYMNSDQSFKARIELRWNVSPKWWAGTIAIGAQLATETYADVTVDKVGESNYIYDAEFVANWVPDTFDNCIADGSVCFDTIHSSVWDANDSEPTCPKYVVFQESSNYWVWTTDDYNKASQAEKNIKAYGYKGFYGSPTTADEYFKEFMDEGILKYDKDGEVTCTDYEEIFGDKEDPESIRYMINTILQYVRVIVPILIILLGTIDFAKAVIAGKEDAMKKAQSDFIKRVIVGVAVFFIPVLVDIVMWLADIVWEGQYPHCPL